MPLGTIALADLLDRNGFSTKIYHTGIEQIHNRNFLVEDLFAKHNPSIVGIDLHWYVHSYDAIRISEIAKQNTNALTVLGGFTASYFAEEIISKFRSVDAAITGDASIPLLELMKKRATSSLHSVPNLVYREGTKVKKNHQKFIADERNLKELNYTNFKLLSNYDKYHQVTTQAGDIDPYGWKIHLKTMAWVPLGRGCSVNCSYCGGGANGHYILTGRSKPVFHSITQIVDILEKFEEEKIDSTYMDFDPLTNRKFYHELFDMIRREKIDISSQFAIWSLTDRTFIKDFSKTFNPLYSTIVLSPESGSEHVRRINKGFYYDNNGLFKWLNDMKEELVPSEIYFATGLSEETQENFLDTVNLALQISEDYPVVSMSCNPIQMEPGGLWFIHPEKFGIKPKWNCFKDYYTLFMKRAQGLPLESEIGYDTIWQTEEQIIRNSVRFNEEISEKRPSRWKKLVDGNDVLNF
jgi:radical SAM superfamily enzyme YgiQ (UPF0313 family)